MWSHLILAMDQKDLDAEELSKLFNVTKAVFSTAGSRTQFSPLCFCLSFHSNNPTIMLVI